MPDVFRHTGDRDGVAVGLVPAGAHFQRHRHVYRLDNGFENMADQRFVFHQRRARCLVADFLRRTAHVDVDDLRAGIDVALRGFHHHLRIAAGDLHDARFGFAAVVHAPPRFVVCHKRTSQVSISPAAIPAPMRRHNSRNGRSVTPAMGASARLFGNCRGRWQQDWLQATARSEAEPDIADSALACPGPASASRYLRRAHRPAPAQAHIESEAFRVRARIDDGDGRVGLLRGASRRSGAVVGSRYSAGSNSRART